MAVKIVDPKTGARVADPTFVGRSLTSGGTGTSWPEVRKQYQSGKSSTDIFRIKSTPGELRSYLEGKTDKLSEDFDEPVISRGGDIRYTRTLKDAMFATTEPVKQSGPELMQKMPTKKATIKPAKGKLRTLPEKELFVDPTVGVRTKTSVSGGMTGGGDGLVRAKSTGGSLKSSRVTNTENKAKGGYKRERELFEAKAGTSVSGIDFSGMSAADIKNKRSELKQDRRDYRRSSLDYETKAPSIKAATMDIRQSRKAETYSKRDTAGKLSHFTSGYKNDETPRAASRIEEFKNSSNNAANRNTMEEKLRAISSKNKTNLY